MVKVLKKKTPIRLLIVDDHPAFRMGLVAIVNSQPDMEVVAVAADGDAAVKAFRVQVPDVLLTDLRMPGLSGVETILAICQEFPTARCIVITTFDCDEDIYRALQSGAKSYLLKDSSMAEIADTIRAVHRGEGKLPANVARLFDERAKRGGFTSRETDVLHLLTRGNSNKEISSSLNISEETVKWYLKSLFLKLGARDRTEAAVFAVRQGIVHLEGV
jgi:two-component system NarL family response regulator